MRTLESIMNPENLDSDIESIGNLNLLDKSIPSGKIFYKTDVLGRPFSVGDIVFANGIFCRVTKADLNGRGSVVFNDVNGKNIALNGRNVLIIPNPEKFAREHKQHS